MSTLVIVILSVLLILAVSFGIFMLSVNVKKVRDNELWIKNGHPEVDLSGIMGFFYWPGCKSPSVHTGSPLKKPGMATLRITTFNLGTAVQIYCKVWVPGFGEVLDPIGSIRTDMNGHAHVSVWLGNNAVPFYFQAREGKVVDVHFMAHATPDLIIPPHWWQRYLGLWA